MKATRRILGRSLLVVTTAVALVGVVGHQNVRSAPPPGFGIDPFEILDLQVKPNVIFILDTSGSMAEDTKYSSGPQVLQFTGDDPAAKMYQAKKALNAVITGNQGKFNFGLASYAALNANKSLTSAPNDTSNTPDPRAPIAYVR